MQDSASTKSSLENAIIELDCPIPPSLNRMWRIGKRHVYKDPKVNRWRREFWYCWILARPKDFKTIDGPFVAEVLVSSKYKRDVDNNAKGIMDACQAVGIISNDGNARKVTQEIVDEEQAPKGCRVRIIPLD